MLTRREYYTRLGVSLGAAVVVWIGGSAYLDSLGLSLGPVLLVDIAATAVLFRALSVYPERYDRYRARFVARREDSRADSKVQLRPTAS